MKVHSKRFYHLGDGLYKDSKTGKYFDEEASEEAKKLQGKTVGTYQPNLTD